VVVGAASDTRRGATGRQVVGGRPGFQCQVRPHRATGRPDRYRQWSQQVVLSIASIARAVETEEPPANSADDPVANTSHPMSVIVRHAEQIAIHYHNDGWSSADAKRISSRLGSTAADRIEMRTTAHIVPAFSVRYFARQMPCG
jgi:hypothetical protein